MAMGTKSFNVFQRVSTCFKQILDRNVAFHRFRCLSRKREVLWAPRQDVEAFRRERPWHFGGFA